MTLCTRACVSVPHTARGNRVTLTSRLGISYDCLISFQLTENWDWERRRGGISARLSSFWLGECSQHDQSSAKRGEELPRLLIITSESERSRDREREEGINEDETIGKAFKFVWTKKILRLGQFYFEKNVKLRFGEKIKNFCHFLMRPFSIENKMNVAFVERFTRWHFPFTYCTKISIAGQKARNQLCSFVRKLNESLRKLYLSEDNVPWIISLYSAGGLSLIIVTVVQRIYSWKFSLMKYSKTPKEPWII